MQHGPYYWVNIFNSCSRSLTVQLDIGKVWSGYDSRNLSIQTRRQKMLDKNAIVPTFLTLRTRRSNALIHHNFFPYFMIKSSLSLCGPNLNILALIFLYRISRGEPSCSTYEPQFLMTLEYILNFHYRSVGHS